MTIDDKIELALLRATKSELPKEWIESIIKEMKRLAIIPACKVLNDLLSISCNPHTGDFGSINAEEIMEYGKKQCHLIFDEYMNKFV